MNILYCGSFLGEGLRKSGHDVVAMRLRSDASFLELVAQACPKPDLVVLELWGKTDLPADIHQCPHRLAAYCIDSSLNEFWLRSFLHVCDDIFVDQLSSVAALRRHGLEAVWLPLCVFDQDIMAPQAKEHFLTFVGRTTQYRTKRKNLLRLLQRHYPVHIVQDVSRQEMLTLFARSRVVLNENLFGGLTLRVFQGLASGALVFTEEGGLGVDHHFKDGKHLVCYNAGNVLQRLSEIESNPEKYQEIARNGQQLCREKHTSSVRAQTFLASIQEGTARNPHQPPALRRFAEAKAKYAHAMRYGGSFAWSMDVFLGSHHGQGDMAAQAEQLLGTIYARKGHLQQARAALLRATASAGAAGFVAAAKLALTHLYQQENAAAAAILDRALAALPGARPVVPAATLGGAGRSRQAMLLLMAQVLMELDQVFELGFLKAHEEKYPDCAFEYALLAWKEGHAPQVLDAIIECARRSQAESEILPLLQEAIAEGAATDNQILYTAELALRLYDPDLAKTITASFRRTLAPGAATPPVKAQSPP